MSDPKIVVVPIDVPGPFEFVGEGDCVASNGYGQPYIRADTELFEDLTLQECAAWVNNPLITGCQGFVGFEYDGGSYIRCYALYDVKTFDPTGSEPSDICAIPDDHDCDHSGSGIGPIVDVRDKTGNACYKYIG